MPNSLTANFQTKGSKPPLRSSISLPPGAKRRSYLILLSTLIVISAVITLGVLSWNNPMPFASSQYWLIAKLRAEALLVIAIVVTCQAFATISFQTVTANRIITPSIMGFEALYVLLQTSAVFFIGTSGVIFFNSFAQFTLQVILMVLFAMLLYGYILSRKTPNLHLMLLVGIVLGAGLSAASTFMQRLLDPSTFDILTARLFGNISNANLEFLPLILPVVLICTLALFFYSPQLNVLSLGQTTAINLGLSYKRSLFFVLLVVSVLMAMTTSLVGPMTFLGFLIATLTYQLSNTWDHRQLFVVSLLLGYSILAGAYFILRHIFSAQGAVTVIVELIGGLTFLFFILRNGRI